MNVEEFRKHFNHFYPHIRIVSLLYERIPVGYTILCAKDMSRYFYLTRMEKGWKISTGWTLKTHDINAIHIVNFILPLYNDYTILDRFDPVARMIINDTKESISDLTPKYIYLGKERFDFME
jgi:hypothetical protein